MNGFHTGLEGPMNSYGEELAIVFARRHVVDVAAVANLLPVLARLSLILVIDSVEAAVIVVLIVSPGDSGHEMDPIATISPRLDASRHGRVDAVNNRDVGAAVDSIAVRLMGLKNGSLFDLTRIWSAGRLYAEGKKEQSDHRSALAERECPDLTWGESRGTKADRFFIAGELR
jgi:hypothetical protein